MKKTIFVFSFILISVFFISCTAPIENTEPPSPPITASHTPVPPTSNPPTSTVTSTPTKTPIILQSSPLDIRYFYDGTIFQVNQGVTSEGLTGLPKQENIKDILLTEDHLFILHLWGIEIVDLDTYAITSLPLPVDIEYGTLQYFPEHEWLVYNLSVTDHEADFSIATHIGIYQLRNDVNKSITYILRDTQVVSISNDGKNLNVILHGQDPGNGILSTVSIASGHIIEERPFEGYDHPLVSSDGKTGITNSLIPTGFNINIYSLEKEAEPQTIELPYSPTRMDYITWTPDQKSIVFALIGGTHPSDIDYDFLDFAEENDLTPGIMSEDLVYVPRIPGYGIWKLDLLSRELGQISPPEFDGYPVVTMSADGRWMLVRQVGMNEAIKLNIETQIFNNFTMSDDNIPKMNYFSHDMTALLCEDANWFIVQNTLYMTVFMSDLETGQTLPVDIPALAKIIDADCGE